MTNRVTPTFQGEVQFRRYSDTSTQGQQIVLALADREALSAFIGKEGKRFMAVLVEIGDDEQPVPPKPAKPGPLCFEAIEYCKDREFWRWIGAKNEAEAAGLVRSYCMGIESRKELDSDPDAAKLFRDGIRNPFFKWQREQRK